MASSLVSSLTLQPSSAFVESARVSGLPSFGKAKIFRVEANVKKIKVDQPLGIGGGMKLRNGVDASGRKPTGKGVYQFTDKYGANVDGYSPIYAPEEWSATGDVYAGGKTGLLIWAITLGAVLLGGALLVYNTSALAS